MSRLWSWVIIVFGLVNGFVGLAFLAHVFDLVLGLRTV